MVHPQQMNVALLNLKRQSYNAFSPLFETKKRVGGRLAVVNEPLFAGYVFVEIAEGQRWVPVQHTFGIRRLLTHQSDNDEYHVPSIIPEMFIERLMACSYYEDDKGSPIYRLKPGTRVRITDGPFASFEGTVTSWTGADRCKLLVWLLNRNVTVEVFAGDIEAVA